MRVIKNNKLTFFDVDDTLIMWDVNPEKEIWTLDYYGTEIKANPHIPHIKQIKKHLDRGHDIVVWTQGGWQWGEVVVQSIINYNLLTEKEAERITVMDKPVFIYDDMPYSAWMPQRVSYLKWEE